MQSRILRCLFLCVPCGRGDRELDDRGMDEQEPDAQEQDPHKSKYTGSISSMHPMPSHTRANTADEEGIRPKHSVATQGDTFYFYPQDESNMEFNTAFTAKRIEGKYSYIKQCIAERLQLVAQEGAQHDLRWKSAPESPLKTSKFLVARNDAFDVEVALCNDDLA